MPQPEQQEGSSVVDGSVERGPVDPAHLHYPGQLPVVERRDDIMAALRDHQVVVIAGETGSGKTTQLPKMCLELGLGATAQIGHTQPRRIAARSVAERIAEEMEVELGDLVGYQVRFTDHSSDRTRLKVMTDGILLAEMQRDRDLRRYDTIIIDEAHERSLNIDFILGYLKSLLPRRPDLKIVITSATIDPARFADHFSTDARGAVVREVPIIEVSGRTFPVEVRYRPLIERGTGGEVTQERDQVTAVCDAVTELWTETPPGHSATDILVFFSGEREIRDAADALNALNLPSTEVLPLYARLSANEQHRVFTRGKGRRIILATNVAETSLTVPGIGYVIDTGTARISRYSQRTKVQRLPIEPISQASASQRSGRCGRVADGVAIRLYSKEEFEARAEFTEPEILRTSLAAVILQMTALGLGDIARFPFVDAPDSKQIADGVRLLDELNALREGKGRRGERRLTAYGKTLARLPLDPRMGRMIIEADRLGCTREVLVIVAALSIQDPRERPVDKEAQAQQQHARFKSETSDFAGFHALWRYLKEQQKSLSGSAFRRLCKAEFLHYLRIREWQDLHQQLRSACKSARIDPDKSTAAQDAEPDWDVVHKALLAGLLSHIGVRDEQKREYAGARGSRFGINPGSGLFKKQPDVVMAAELVETTRLWARVNAAIDPEWAEEVGAHVIKRTFSEPRWSKSAGSVVASERVTLYGVPLIVDRTVQYGRIDAEVSRDLFIRNALVEGDWDTHHKFWKANTQLLQRLSELEERARRRDLIVDDEVVFAFYDARIPPEVTSVRHFDRWWKGEQRSRPDLLTFTEELLTREDVDIVSAGDYPHTWLQGDLALDVTYQFSPGEAADGVTVHVPTAVLNQVTPEGFDWQVPGLREDLAVALLKSLPKATRRHFVPTPDRAREALARAEVSSGAPLTHELARVLKESTGVSIPAGEWDWDRVPDHLRITFSVEAPGGRVIARGMDLDELRPKSQGAVRQRMAKAGASIERGGLTDWSIDAVPRTFEGRSEGHTVQGHPALVDEGSTVSLRVLDHAGSAEAAHRAGVRRLLLLNTTAPWKRVLARLTNAQKLALGQNPHGSVPALLEDCLAAAVDSIVADLSSGATGGEVRTKAAFDAAHDAVRAHVVTRVLQVIEGVEPVLALAGDVRRRLDALETSAARRSLVATTADVRAQLDGLIRPGFVADSGVLRLPHLQRYLRAMLQRLDKAATNPREAKLQEQIDGIETAYADLLDDLPAIGRRAPEVTDIAWMIEELRVSLFAQALGTAHPVSEKRVRNAIATVTP
ncbi:MAG: ATP-dependent RNA helicase HrpA [Knoellia sp.]